MVAITIDSKQFKEIIKKYSGISEEKLEKWIIEKCKFYNKLNQEDLEKYGFEEGKKFEWNDKIKDSILLIDSDYKPLPEQEEIDKLIYEKKGENEQDKEINADKVKIKLGNIYQGIIDILKRYIDMREDYYPLVACWIIGTYVHKTFRTYPYLYFNAMKGSGKSRTLSLIAHLSYNGKMVVNMSEAVLFRTAKDSTICIDEFERTKGKEKANLRELLNAAYKQGISVERAKKVIGKHGEDFKIEKFDVFCPIAMANISGMDEVLGDRSIKLTLERSQLYTKTRKLEIWGLDGLIRQNLDALVSCSVMLRHVLKYIEELYIQWNNILDTNITHNILNTTQHYSTLISKVMKSSLNGRHLELFFPLFIIADYCNDLDRILEIAEKIVSEKREEDIYENRDISLIDFVSRQHEEKEWVSQKMLLQSFKEFLEVEDDKWLNAQWFGIALNRLNLLLDQRRLGRGKEVILNIDKAKEKIKMFK